MKLTSMVVLKPNKGKEEKLIPAMNTGCHDLYKTGYTFGAITLDEAVQAL